MKRLFIIEGIAIIIAALFLYTGLSKLWGFAVFRAQLADSPWHLLASMSNVVAWALPIGELFLVCLLVWPVTRKAGFILSAVLFLIFILYLGLLLHSGKRLPCSCGGIVSSMSWQAHVYFNIFFLLLSLTGLYLDKRFVWRRPKRERPIDYRQRD